ncbi:MAG: AAA family ATPase [Pirellulales bacterium]|nr:AAA family ATPase [Pirellulales bacterium]
MEKSAVEIRSGDKPSEADGAYSPGSVLFGRFRVERVLKRDRDTETFLATELESGQPAVIKAIRTGAFPAGALMRLEHKALRLRHVRSPWLTPLLDVRREKDWLLLAAKYIPGVPLRERLDQGALDLEEALVLGWAIFSALREMHRLHVLHRAVRPSNLIVNPRGPVTETTLVDYGPVRSFQTEAQQRERSLDVAVYASPEQAGSIDQDVSEPSDLYTAGIVLFECLAGRPPFQGENIGTLLLAHMTVRPPELRSLGIAVPRAVDELIGRLLRKDPRNRYQSAGAVLADLEAIIERIRQGEADPAVVIGAHDRRGTLTDPAFVARTSELAALDEQIRRARRGQAGLVLVEGESGSGKTRLMVEVAQRAARDGFRVFRGQGSTEVAQQPFHLLQGIVDGFVSAGASSREFAESVRGRLEGYQDTLVAALPDLAKILDCQPSQLSGPEDFGEVRTTRALAKFLDALGCPEYPALILLDDCQWADDLTYKLLRHWQTALGESAAGGRYVLVAASFRTEEVPEGHLLRRMRPACHLPLSPFRPEEVRQLAESMAGPLPEEALEAVTRLAEGSPFMASAVLWGLAESGALVAEGSGWRIEPRAMADVSSSSHVAAFLARRIERLSPEVLQILSVGAILGKEFDLEVVARLTRLTPEQVLTALDDARRRRLLWSRPDGAQCIFVHDQIRFALLTRLTTGQRQELHRRAALFFQEHTPDCISEIAYHFDAAGDSRSALPYAFQAAEHARSAHALENAEQQYCIAQRGAAAADPATRFRIAEGLGDVLMLRGRYDAAGEQFESAVALAEGALAQAQIRGRLSELAFKRGDMENAIRSVEEALRLLGRIIPRRKSVFFAWTIWEILIQVLHTYFPKVFVGRCQTAPSEEFLLGCHLYSRLAYGSWFARGKLQTFWAVLHELNLIERYPLTPGLARAYGEQPPVMALIGHFSRGIAYGNKSLQMWKELGDLWGQGLTLQYLGDTLYAASRYHECIDKCREAVRLLERTGDFWQVHIGRYQVAAALYHLGDLQGAVEESQINYRSGLELGDKQATGIILDIWARATCGAVPEPILRQELDRPRDDVQGSAQLALAEGVCLLGSGNAIRAAEVLEKALRTADRAGVKNVYTFPLLTWLATAYRCQAEQTPEFLPRRRKQLLRRAGAAVRRAVRWSRLCKNDLPQALRESALIEAMRGKVRKARALFEKSLAVARQLGQRYQYALTLSAQARMGCELGWPDAEMQAVEAQAALDEFLAFSRPAVRSDPGKEKSVSLSLIDRFSAVLESGRRIALALSPEAIYDEVRSAAARLLRAEQCLVLQVDETRNPPRVTLAAGGKDAEVNKPMVLQALQAGRTVTAVEPRVHSASDSAAHYGQRSVLCAPISLRGRNVACLYAVHEHVHGLFGPDEEQLANFIAVIAGAALENAEGFSQLQHLNEALEQRIVERERVQKELLAAKQSAEAANVAKSRFLANISHEIRTPLNAILGFTELLRVGADEGNEAERQDFLQTIGANGQHLLSLINDILDLSKIDADRLEVEYTTCDPQQIISEVISAFRARALEKGLSLESHGEGAEPRRIRSDPHRLRQVLMNLVGNALKFTQTGGVRIVAELYANPPEPMLKLQVIDTGIGIPAEKLEAIFEPFVQADGSVTRQFGGTGLGLTISRRIAEALGGALHVESAVGEGSTFTLSIPAGPREEIVFGAPVPSAALSPTPEISPESVPSR